jgi:hypothetical protein
VARLYDYQTESAVNVDDSRVEDLIASGNYAFIQGDKVTLVGEDDTLYDFPADKAYAALRAGYRYAPIELVETEDLKATVSDSPFTSAGLGALRTMSFGLSDMALQNLGFTDEEIRMHRELNPIATTAGELGGLVFPFGGTSLVARGAARGAQKLVGSISKAASNKKALRTLASPLNTRVVKGAVGGAAEGAVVGVPYAVSSQILDDPERRPEFSEHIIAGAGFGGIAGGLVGGIATALSKGGSALKFARDRAYYRTLDPKKTEWNKITRHGNYSRGANEFGAKLANLDKKGIVKNLDDPEALLMQLEDDLLPYYGKRLDDIITDVESKMAKSGQYLDDLKFDPDAIAKRMIREIVDNPRAMGAGLVDDAVQNARIKNARQAIEDFRDIAWKNMNPIAKAISQKLGMRGKTLNFRDSEELKRFYQRELANFKKNPDNFAHYESMANIIREESENALAAIGNRLSNTKGIKSDTYANFLEAKDVYATLKNLHFFAQGAAARQANNARLPLTSYVVGAGLGGGVFGAADSVLTGGLGAAATFAGTALARKYIRDNGELLFARTLRRISDYGGMLNLADKSQKAMDAGVSLILRGGAAAGVKVKNPIPDSPEKTIEEFIKTRNQLDNLNGNPQTLYPRFLAMLPEVEGDQTLNQSVANTMANGVSFLHSKLPKSTTAPSELVFNPTEEVPRFSEILKFNRYKTIVDNPNLVLPMIAQGSLQPEHVEAMQAVYPALYQAQMKMLVERVMTRNRNLDTVVRNSLSRFFQARMNASLRYTNQMQQMYTENAEKMGPPSRQRKMDAPAIQTQFQSAQTL